jgi:hypothetical protein
LRARARQPCFGTDEKRIRTKNTVMEKSKLGVGLLLSKIVDCVRMCFSSARNRRSARTGRRPRKLSHFSSMCGPKSIDSHVASIARSRAPTMFLVRMKSASVPKPWLLIKAKAQLCNNGRRESQAMRLSNASMRSKVLP